MSDVIPAAKQRCKAMKMACISDPESGQGINFCVTKCPYDYCIVFEHKVKKRVRNSRDKMRIAKELRSYGISTEDIALVLNGSVRSIQRYLRTK